MRKVAQQIAARKIMLAAVIFCLFLVAPQSVLAQANPYLTLNPNPFRVCSGQTGSTTANAWAPVSYQIKIDDPNSGSLFTSQGANVTFSQATGNWVSYAQNFYLVETGSNRVLAQTTALFYEAGCPSKTSAADAYLYRNIRSTVWYEFGPRFGQMLRDLQSAAPKIAANGFNTVWLVTPWNDLNPQPLANPPVYNPEGFSILKQTLQVLRNNHLKALMGLNYLGSGWAPAGIDACNWITLQNQYQSFETYTNEVMKQLDGYQDVVSLMVFTENSEPCNLSTYNDAEKISALLRPTLGSLPEHLNPTLRAKFRIGYHDYDEVNLGWAHGLSPVKIPNAFNFVSLSAYGLEALSDSAINSELDTRSQRFRNTYAISPLIIGELGANYCTPYDELNQSRVDKTMVSYGLSHGYGIDVWGWKPAAANFECVNGNQGLSLTRSDGSLRPAATTLKNLFQTTPLH